MQQHNLSRPPGNLDPLGAAVLATMGIASVSMPALPQVFEQYPYGTAVLVGLVIYSGACRVAVAWLQRNR